MNVDNLRRGRAHTIPCTPSVTNSYEKEDYFVQVFRPEWGGSFSEGVLSRSRSSSSSMSDSLTDDSVDIDRYRDTNIENKHFEKALNQGVFDSVYEATRKDRRRSFEKEQHRHKKHDTLSHSFHGKSSDSPFGSGKKATHSSKGRARSSSFDIKLLSENPSESYRRKKTSRHRKLRQELSNGGINLHDANDKLSIDEIYELQNRFFSDLKLTDKFNRQTSVDEVLTRSSQRDSPICSPTHKRSGSFQ